MHPMRKFFARGRAFFPISWHFTWKILRKCNATETDSTVVVHEANKRQTTIIKQTLHYNFEAQYTDIIPWHFFFLLVFILFYFVYM